MRIEVGSIKKEDNKEEFKVCPFCQTKQPLTKKFCGSCGEEFIITSGVSNKGTGEKESTSPQNSDNLSPVPFPIPEGKSEVRKIADRLGIDKTVSEDECMNIIENTVLWCKQEIDFCENKLDQFHNMSIPYDNRLVRAKMLLKQTDVQIGD